MSEHETHKGFPEIRKDLNYEFECDSYPTWLSWQQTYKDLPNVQVTMKIKQAIPRFADTKKLDFRTNTRKEENK